IKQVVAVEKESEITKNEDLINLRPKDSTNTRNHIEKKFMENKPQPNEICSLKSMRQSTNTKEEDSPTPHYHSDKENNNLNLGINYFSLDKAKESQINRKEEISEEINNRQKKHDQKDLSKPTNMEEIESDGILLTED
ncbi:hypothetical protein O181_113798, partial [Austropuccinia psidii MF-1]|nr:hypothetical protein [Austropuccinia psidii MF-1]